MGFKGVGSALDAKDLVEQAREDARQAAVDSASIQRDREFAAAERDRTVANIDAAIHGHVVKLLKLLADPIRPRDVQRNLTLDRMRSDLADAVELLWPAA